MCGLFRPRLTEKQKNGVLCKTKAAVTLTLANRLNEFSTICQQNLKQQCFTKNKKKKRKILNLISKSLSKQNEVK